MKNEGVPELESVPESTEANTAELAEKLARLGEYTERQQEELKAAIAQAKTQK